MASWCSLVDVVGWFFWLVDHDSNIKFLLESVIDVLSNSEREIRENVKLSPQVIDLEERDVSSAAAAMLEKTGADLFAIFQKPSMSYEEGMGLADAEAHDIPLDLGSLRDQVKKKVADRQARIKATHVLSEFLEKLAVGATNLASTLTMKSRSQANYELR